MLGAAQTDPAGPLFDGVAGVLGRIRVGVDAQRAVSVRPCQRLGDAAFQRGLHLGQLAQKDLPGVAIDADPVQPFHAGVAEAHLVHEIVDMNSAGAHDAALAHAPRHHGRVRGQPAMGGHDSLGDLEPVDVLRGGLMADENGLDALARQFHGVLGEEHRLTHRGSWRGGQSLAQCRRRIGLVQHGILIGVDDGGVQQQQRLTVVADSFRLQLQGNPQAGLGGSWRRTAAQQPKPLPVDGKLHLLRIAEVALQLVGPREQFAISLGYRFRQCLHFVRHANARREVPSHGRGEEVPVGLFFTRAGNARENTARPASLPRGSTGHRLQHEGRSRQRIQILLIAVRKGLRMLPGLEPRDDRPAQVLQRIGGPGSAGLLLTVAAKLLGQAFQCAAAQLMIGLGAPLFQRFGHQLLEAGGFDAQHVHAVALDQAAVRIPRGPVVPQRFGKGGCASFGQPQVYDRIQRARHGLRWTGAQGEQQRRPIVTKAPPRMLFQARYGAQQVFLHGLREFAVRVRHQRAEAAGQHEAGWHRCSQLRHLNKDPAFFAHYRRCGQFGIVVLGAEKTNGLVVDSVLHGGLLSDRGMEPNCVRALLRIVTHCT